jgi:hypothetical protein
MPKEKTFLGLLRDAETLRRLKADALAIPTSLEKAPSSFTTLLYTELRVTLSRSTKNTANKASGWNRWLSLPEVWQRLVKALEDDEEGAEPVASNEEPVEASLEEKACERPTSQGEDSKEDKAEEPPLSQPKLALWADLEDNVCDQCFLVVPRLFLGRGPHAASGFCEGCWSSWLWNARSLIP